MNTLFRTKMYGLVAALIVALCAALKVQAARLERQERRTAELALQASNAIAERDSTHDLALENKAVARLLGDSLRMVEKQVVQVKQKADALDNAVNRERVAKYALAVTLDSVRLAGTSTTSEAVSSNDLREASFNIRQEPVTLRGRVRMPPPPDTATITMDLALDAIDLETRISCSEADRDGIRRAIVSTASMSWASVRFSQVQQAPEICNARPIGTDRHRWRFHLAPAIGVGLPIGRYGRRPASLIVGATILIRN